MTNTSEKINLAHPSTVRTVATIPLDIPPKFVSIKSFEVLFLNKKRKEIEKKIFTFDFKKEQDVIDLAAYYVENVDKADMNIYLAVNQSIRPAKAARIELDENNNGLHWDLPAGYVRLVRGHAGIVDTVLDILENKINLTADGPIEFLGGSYFPSVGGSTELVLPRAIQVKKPDNLKRVIYGKGFERSRRIQMMELQEIVDKYFTGEIEDTRLLEAAFRLARYKGKKLEIPIQLQSEEIDTPINQKIDPKIDQKIQDKRIIEGKKLQAEMHELHNNSDISAVVINETNNQRSNSFLRVKTYKVENENSSGEIIDTYNADIIFRKGVDSVDIGTYFWNNKKLYMGVKVGVRPAIAVRSSRRHPLHIDANPFNVEGVSGSCNGEEAIEDFIELAKNEIEEELGVLLKGKAIYVGTDFPSVGHNVEKVHRILAEIDPTKKINRKQTIDETVKVFYIELDELLQLADQGTVRDMRLSLNAHLLKNIFNYGTFEALHDSEIKTNYLALINQGSHIQKWLAKNALEIDVNLHESAHYRRLKGYCENELGLVGIEFSHNSEKGFFDPLIPLFAIPHPKDANKLPFYLLHDMRHYTLGDFVPYKITNKGTLTSIDLQIYQRAKCGNECEAVYFSDVLMPEHFGVNRAEKLFGGNSVAGAMNALEITQEEARNAIISIEREGIIPKKIINHKNFEKYRDVFIGRLLRFHVLDREKTKRDYEEWMKHPEVGKTALQFCNAYNNVEEYESTFSKTLDQLLSYSEGTNPLKAEISRTINMDIRITALNLAYMKEYLLENVKLENTKLECEKIENKISKNEKVENTESENIKLEKEIQTLDIHLELLKRSYDCLLDTKKRIEDIDCSTENIAAYQLLQNLQEGIIKDSGIFLNSLTQKDFLTSVQKENIQGKTVYFFVDPGTIDTAFVKNEMDRLERESRE